MGSAGIAAAVAKTAFLGLVVWGVAFGELRAKGTAVFLVLGVAAWFGLPYLPRGEDFVTPALALIDVAMVLTIFKGDIRIT